jgi:isovaleryl-CoA dehydrogenase
VIIEPAQLSCAGAHLMHAPRRLNDQSEDESAVVEVVWDFVDYSVKAIVREVQHSNTYPERLIDQMERLGIHGLGIYGLAIPAPWGEAQVAVSTCHTSVTEEVLRGCASATPSAISATCR